MAEDVVGFVGNLIFTPIFVVIVLCVGAAITHLLVPLLGRPQNAGFEATFRVGAYIQAVQLISWIPIIGWLVALVWGIVLYIVGLREVHSTTTGRAALVALIPIALILILVLLLGVIGAALFLESQQNQQQF